MKNILNNIKWNHLDRKSIERKYPPKSNGKQMGLNNQPSSSELSLSNFENEIFDTGRDHFQSEINRNDDILVKAEALMLQKQSLIEDDSFENIPTQFKQDCSFSYGSFKSQLQDNSKQLDQATNYFNSFKERNAITRPPTIKTFWQTTISIGLIFIFIIFELFGNTLFLGPVMMGGFAAAFITALTISSINVGISFFIGIFVMRGIHHIDRAQRYISWLLMTLYFGVFILWVNFMVGAFRHFASEAMAKEMDLKNYDITQTELLEMGAQAAAPWLYVGQLGIESWLLIIMGLFFAAIGAYDGYQYSDTYPGYGKVAKKVHNLKESIRKSTKNQLDLVNNGYRKYCEAANGTHAEDKINILDWTTNMNAFQAVYYQFERHAAKWEDDIWHIIKEFRNANKEARSDNSPPSYFSERIKYSENYKDPMKAFKATAFAFKSDEDLAKKKTGMDELVTSHYNNCMKEIEEIKDEYNKKIESEVNKIRM